MYAILKEQVAAYALQEQVVRVVRIEDYSIPSGMLESTFTEAGQLLGSDGASSPATIAQPTVEGDILRARLGQTVKMAWETVDLAQLVQTAVKTGAYTAINNDHVLVDASGAGADFEIALPATPAAGNKVRVTMVAEHATYKVTIGRNGSLVNGGTSTTDLSLVKKGDSVYFEYTGATLGWSTLPKSVHNAINTATAKTTPVDADRWGIWDSVSGLLNHVTWANIKATLKTYLDTLYMGLTNATTVASSAAPAPVGSYERNLFTVTALAEAATFAAPSGTPVNGNMLLVRILDNGTARALAYNAIYRAVGVTLKTTTVISKTQYFLAVYNSAASKWDVIAVGEQA